MTEPIPLVNPDTLGPGDVVAIASVAGRVGTDGMIHFTGIAEPFDPRRLPLRLLYPADNVRNDPLLTVRRNPDHRAADPHASRAFLLPAGSNGCPWWNPLDNHEMGHDEVEYWAVEDIGDLRQLYGQHHADEPDCTRCRPWRVLDTLD